MKKVDKNAKKPTKTTKNVMVQPFNGTWPNIEGSFPEFCSMMKTVEHANIVTGCNAVIKLLQDGQAAAFFCHERFHPKAFARLIFRMALRRNPSVVFFAVPECFKHLQSRTTLTAIRHGNADQPSEATRAIVSWMQHTSRQLSSSKTVPLPGNKTVSVQRPKRPEKQPQKPMTEEEVAKLYVLEPVADAKKKPDDPFKSADFISFSDNDKTVTIKSDSAYVPLNKPLIDRKLSKNSTYLPLRVNKVQPNPNRVEKQQKKRRKTANKQT